MPDPFARWNGTDTTSDHTVRKNDPQVPVSPAHARCKSNYAEVCRVFGIYLLVSCLCLIILRYVDFANHTKVSRAIVEVATIHSLVWLAVVGMVLARVRWVIVVLLFLSCIWLLGGVLNAMSGETRTSAEEYLGQVNFVNLMLERRIDGHVYHDIGPGTGGYHFLDYLAGSLTPPGGLFFTILNIVVPIGILTGSLWCIHWMQLTKKASRSADC